MFYNVYIKKGVVASAATLFDALDTQPLDGFQKLQLVDAEIAWNSDPIIHDMADGTGWVVEETTKFACGTLDVSKGKYAALREYFHNQICTIAIFDPHNLKHLSILHGVLVKLYVIAESEDVVKIKIEAERKHAPNTIVIDHVSILDIDDFFYLEGHIYDHDGAPIKYALVSDGEYLGEMETDSSGFFFGFLYASAKSIEVDATGYDIDPIAIDQKSGEALLGIEIYANKEMG
ncbi:MAG: carboxypeptidase-like regulatory domain-containing protein [Candidatus Cloacimonetes bacterium]|nr:carboxypeptidase-like regulatory domain-containing protein [Candidatus Cloacimonadota bacterium]